MQLQFVEGEAVSRIDGQAQPAMGAVCEQCGGYTFKIFLIGQLHQHLECATCGTSYCDGSCDTPQGVRPVPGSAAH